VSANGAKRLKRRERRPAAGPPALGPRRARIGAGDLFAAGAAFVAAFLLSSPYVLLDHQNSWAGFNYERLHMRLGHFGLDRSPAIIYYARVLTGSLLGWPLALAGAAGLVVLGFARRRAWALVLAVFPAAYVGLISSFSMKAERYILPLLPIAAVLASAFAVEMLGRRSMRRAAAAAAAALVVLCLAAPSLLAYARGLSRLREDTRTLARRWIEANVPSGSCIVSESYGPEPLTAMDLAGLSQDVRERIQKQVANARVYAMLPIPMIQVRPELVAVFYDLALYDDYADYIVTSSSVGSRYRKDPALFARQLAFYEALERRYALAREFGPADGSGPTLRLYRNPRHTAPFVERDSVASPAAGPRLPEPLPGLVGLHYERLAVNLESFGHYVQAAEAYLLAASYTEARSTFQHDVMLGAVRAYLLARRLAEAVQVLEQAMRAARDPAEVQYWEDLRKRLFAAR
jgi:hypothetical protein